MTMHVPRAMRALLLTLLISVSGVAAAGFLANDYGPAPESLALPALPEGATGHYNVQGFNRTSDGHWEPVGPVARGVEFRNIPPRWILDKEGQPRMVSAMETTTYGYVMRTSGPELVEPVWAPKIHFRHLSDAKGASVAIELDAATQVADRNQSLADVAGIPVVTETSRGSAEWQWRAFVPGDYRQLTMCGLVNPLQGREVKLGGEVDLGSCMAWVAAPLPAGAVGNGSAAPQLFAYVESTFTVLGGQEFNGSPTVVLEAPAKGLGEAEARVRLWLSPDEAIPVQLALFSQGHAFVLQLAGFTQEPHSAPGLAPTPAPDLKWAPRQPWGPVDADSGFFFPASQAWAARLDDPIVRQYFENHPEAEAVDVYSNAESSIARDEVDWHFLVTDGKQPFRFIVEAERAPLLGVRLGWLTGLDDPMMEPTIQVRVEDYQGTGNLATPKQLPPLLPTAGSSASVWKAHTGLAHLEPTPGFRIDCMGAACDETHWSATTTGYATSTQLNATRRPGAVHFEATAHGVTLTIGEEGVQSILVTTGRTAGNYAPSPIATGLPPMEAPHTAKAWHSPSAAVAAATGLAALLIGLVYYLWPNLKAGAMGLFSRLRQEQVLEHPVRQQILAAIQAEPGIHFQELVRRLGVGRGTVEHHVRHLESRGHIHRRTAHGYTCFVARGTDRRVLASAGAVRSVGARAILAAIEAMPGTSIADAARATGLERSTAHHHVKRLAEAGLVRRGRDGRTVRLWRVPAV